MKQYPLILLSLLIFSFQLQQVYLLNILGVFPYEGKSHPFVFKPLLEELALRGHNVTVISCFPREKSLNIYHDISLADEVEIIENNLPMKKSYYAILQISMFLVSTGTNNCRVMLANKNVRNLVESKIKFDIALIEQFISDCGLALAYKLNIPVIGVSAHVMMPWYYNRFGVPYNPSFVSFRYLEGGTKPTLYQRIERAIFDAYFKIVYKLLMQREDQKTIALYYDDVPPLEKLARDIKFQLSYTNFILTGSNLFPPNVIEVGGFHVAKPTPLPDDIKKFIEESKHGVIYISFGTVLKSNTAPKEKIEAIVAALSELPQRVIWKWEAESLPGNAKNIYSSKWLPQNDILAHPNVLAFYSHCGMLGTTEAMYHGVPMVAMPIFGDQPANAAAVEESGLGVQIQLNELTKTNLVEKIKTVLDPKFRERVKVISKAWHDRPLSAMDTAIFWTEFAGNHRNFTFRTPAADVPMYQYLCLDILSVFIIFIIVVIVSLKYILCLLLRKKSIVTKSKHD